MDSLDIAGKKYISSKQAAKRTGYAQDYIGQLARGGKVPGTRVGRAWYVEEEAILAHAGIVVESIAATASGKPSEASNEHSAPLTQALSLPRQVNITKPLHSLHQVKNTNFKTWEQVRYLEDSADLLPKLNTVSKEESPIKINRITSDNIASSPNFVTKEPTVELVSVQKIKKHTSNRSMQLLPLGLAAALALMLTVSAASGIYLSDSWSFQAGSHVASLGGQYDSIFAILFNFFQEGITLLVSFMVFFLNSLEAFFNLGVAFFSGIFK